MSARRYAQRGGLKTCGPSPSGGACLLGDLRDEPHEALGVEAGFRVVYITVPGARPRPRALASLEMPAANRVRRWIGWAWQPEGYSCTE